MIKPKIDQEKCIGCGTCAAICPEVFELNSEGKAEVKPADYEAFENRIKEAQEACPVEAISLDEN